MNAIMTTTNDARRLADWTPMSNPRVVWWIMPALVLAAVLWLTRDWAAWARMWLTAFGVYFVCKAWVVMAARHRGLDISMLRLSQFVFAWAGMAPEPFGKPPSDQEINDDVKAAERQRWCQVFSSCLFGVDLLRAGAVRTSALRNVGGSMGVHQRLLPCAAFRRAAPFCCVLATCRRTRRVDHATTGVEYELE